MAVVVVVDPLPMYRHGVAAVLAGAGHTIEAPADLPAWAQQAGQAVVLLTLESEPAWELLRTLREAPAGHHVIALVDGNHPVLGVQAVRAGARSVLWRTVTAEALRRTVDAALDGQTVLPAAVGAALAAGSPTGGTSGWSPSSHQLAWLRRLAAGSTVARLASDAGYSERAMFRLLRSLYEQLGVTSRTEAIIRAQELGWLSP